MPPLRSWYEERRGGRGREGKREARRQGGEDEKGVEGMGGEEGRGEKRWNGTMVCIRREERL